MLAMLSASSENKTKICERITLKIAKLSCLLREKGSFARRQPFT